MSQQDQVKVLASRNFYSMKVKSLVSFRYYNGDFPYYTEDHINFLKDFFLAQIDSYETGPSGVGWFMWTMKVEGEHEAGPEWDFLYLWRNGVIPVDLCNRDHYCGNKL